PPRPTLFPYTTLFRSTAETVAEARAATSEPLRMLILGQVKAGKSSLVNALFGAIRAATDVVPTTAQLTPYVLERADMGVTVILSDRKSTRLNSSHRTI